MAPSNLPRLDEVTLNSRVLIFTLLLSLGSGLFFGLFPVLRHRKGKLVDALKEGGRGGMKDRGRNPKDILSVRLYIPGREVSSTAEVATTYEAIVHRLEQIPGVTSVGLAFGVTRLMSAVLFGVNPADPLTFGLVAVGLRLVALLGSYLPARRAAGVDPTEALRGE